MQNLLTKITLKPLLHQIKNENLLLSIDRICNNFKRYTNDTQGCGKCQKIYVHFCKTLDFKIESYHPNINVVLYNLKLYVFKIVLLY